ncbi:MAG TPA: stage II sporulation protein R [Peptococcaceae bacterium]|nr:stage II sporulation protein R [Peptococcaceae bacterium]
MFKRKVRGTGLEKKRICLGLVFAVSLGFFCLLLVSDIFSGQKEIVAWQDLNPLKAGSQDELFEFAASYWKDRGEIINIEPDINPESIIRFHVLANSDSAEDQNLKYAVRDAILKQIGPRLAESTSLEQSREIIREVETELLTVAEEVVKEWGKDYPVTMEYGKKVFPTKSYGNIVLPGGTYEAVQVKIGEARGANWWCVLFPPLCFVNVEEPDTINKDVLAGQKAEDISRDTSKDISKVNETGDAQETKCTWSKLTYKGKKVGFYLSKFFKGF